jgi:hypothetical protein
MARSKAALRLRDRLVPPLTVPRFRGFFPAALGLLSCLLPLEFKCGLSGCPFADLRSGSVRRFRASPSPLTRLSGSQVGALICSFIENALSDGGFKASSVHSGEPAMSTFWDGREQCRALLTDVNGDGISGWELARQIRKITPGFPAVYMTSASAPNWKSQGVDGTS